MQKYIYLLFIIILTISCKNSTSIKNYKYFKNNTWYINNEPIFRNDSSISTKRFDASQNKMVDDTLLFPANITDSTISYKTIVDVGEYDDSMNYHITHDSIVENNVIYDLKYINNEPKLILYHNNFPIICSSKNKNIHFIETNNFKRVNFLMSGFAIGDQVDRTILKTKGIYNYKNYTIEDCELIENPDVKFKIIGYNIIYSIERHNISNNKINDIIKVVNNKLHFKPEYSPMKKWSENSDYQYEFYRWSINGVVISLSRSKYIGSTAYKNLLNNNEWTLNYDDNIQRAILIETYQNEKPKSTLIK